MKIVKENKRFPNRKNDLILDNLDNQHGKMLNKNPSNIEPVIKSRLSSSFRNNPKGNENNLKPHFKPIGFENPKYDSDIDKYKSENNSKGNICSNGNENNLNLLPRPIGFENPKGYCFLNCVIQQFFSCKDFRENLIEYHNSSQIANSNSTEEKKIFVNDFCKLMDEIKKRDDEKIREYVSNVQKFFKNSSFGDDVLKCFMDILSVVSDVTKKLGSGRKSASIAVTSDHSFQNFEFQHGGFVFDSFYGQMIIRLFCAKCQYEFNKCFQLFKTIVLLVPKSTETISLENVINNYLEQSIVLTDNKMNCNCCGGCKNLFSIIAYTHMPSYLFIYLNRSSNFKDDEKNNTFINIDKFLFFPTEQLPIKYRLISVIDHIGDNLGGHYYVKSCFESDQWWLLNDSSVTSIQDNESIVTKQTIVFLFRKCSE